MKKRYLRLVRQALKALRHKRLRDRPWWRTVSRPIANRALWIPCRDTVANGLAIGLFFSMMLMPLQMLPAALIAMRSRANVPFAMAGCWFTNPLTAPAAIYAQMQLGHWLQKTLSLPVPHFLSMAHHVPGVGSVNAAAYIVGMLVSGVILALCAYPIVHLFSAILPQHLPVRRRRRCGKATAEVDTISPDI